MKGLIIGDSVAMPSSAIAYSDAWTYLIRNKYPNIDWIDKASPGSMTRRLNLDTALEMYNPDVVITQLGVVDSAPRIAYRLEKKIIVSNPILPDRISDLYMSVISKIRTRRPRRAYMPPEDFYSNLDSYYERAGAADVDVFSIITGPGDPNLESKSPHLTENIQKYNNMYRELEKKYQNVTIVDPFSDIDDLKNIYAEGVHLNEAGHQLVYESIYDAMSDLYEPPLPDDIVS
jgi:lysophospholipase L1-like esterase